MFFDTHAHLDDEAFDSDRSELIESLSAVGVNYVLNAASDMKSSRGNIELCEKYDCIYGAVGIHPDSADTLDKEMLCELEALTSHKKIVAIGETGLDYYYDSIPREVQRKCFADQAALAYELKLPLIIHDRDAHLDCINIVKKFPGIKAVYHCFSGSVEYSREILKLGCFMSFGGAITFKNARHAPEVLREAPRERIMLETDCPYMAPVPYRGKRNHPGYIPQIAERLSELWGTTPEEVGRITTNNAKAFFGI